MLPMVKLNITWYQRSCYHGEVKLMWFRSEENTFYKHYIYVYKHQGQSWSQYLLLVCRKDHSYPVWLVWERSWYFQGYSLDLAPSPCLLLWGGLSNTGSQIFLYRWRSWHGSWFSVMVLKRFNFNRNPDLFSFSSSSRHVSDTHSNVVSMPPSFVRGLVVPCL